MGTVRRNGTCSYCGHLTTRVGYEPGYHNGWWECAGCGIRWAVGRPHPGTTQRARARARAQRAATTNRRGWTW